jgi:hypothetical protein
MYDMVKNVVRPARISVVNFDPGIDLAWISGQWEIASSSSATVSYMT